MSGLFYLGWILAGLALLGGLALIEALVSDP